MIIIGLTYGCFARSVEWNGLGSYEPARFRSGLLGITALLDPGGPLDGAVMFIARNKSPFGEYHQ